MTEGNFVDYVKINLASGKGGKGSTHLRREKFLEVQTPKIIASATEGGTSLFEMKYFDKTNPLSTIVPIIPIIIINCISLKSFIKKIP